MSKSGNERFRKNWDAAFQPKMSALSSPIQYPIDTTGSNETAAEDADLPNPKDSVFVITQRSDEEIGRYKTDSDSERSFRRKSLRVQWFLFWATAAAFGAAAYYAYVAKHQAETMDDTLAEARKQTRYAESSLKATQDNFRIDQRPYVWLTNNQAGPQIVFPTTGPQGQLIWDWHYTNYGKTPAYSVTIAHKMSIYGHPFKLSFGSKGDLHAAPLPPTKDDFSTVVSEPVTVDYLGKLGHINFDVSVSGVINYTDGSGVKYETGFCLYRLPTGANGYCKEGNYIK